MLRRFLTWRKESKRWRQSHETTWEPAIIDTPDGLNGFMHQARDAVTRTCGHIHFEVRGKSENYLHGSVPGTELVIYIYGEGAQIFDGTREVFWSEYHDYETPAHLIDELVASAKNAIASAKAAKLKTA